MEENKKNQKEEIQSRREFFKNAAKGVLPILGVVLLSHIPTTVLGKQTNSCDYTCSYSCKETCESCQHACSVGCGSTCSGKCIGSCYAVCQNSSYNS